MTENKYPEGWDAERVQRLIDHYDNSSDEDLAAEDDAAYEADLAERNGLTIMSVPVELVPAVRELIANHKAAA